MNRKLFELICQLICRGEISYNEAHDILADYFRLEAAASKTPAEVPSPVIVKERLIDAPVYPSITDPYPSQHIYLGHQWDPNDAPKYTITANESSAHITDRMPLSVTGSVSATDCISVSDCPEISAVTCSATSKDVSAFTTPTANIAVSKREEPISPVEE